MFFGRMKTLKPCKTFTENSVGMFLIVRQPPIESFLSCAANQHFETIKKVLTPTCIKFTDLISCENSKSHKSQSNNALDYRAESIKKDFIIGIDPGITGAVAVISKGKFVAVFDFPTLEIKVGNKLKTRIDLDALSFLIESYSKDVFVALIEEVGQITTKSDPFASFVFGFATGSVHGILTSNQIKIETVKPNVWKPALGLDSDKSKSISKAIALFPEAETHLKRKKDHGRAEALLLAHFAWKLMGKKS